MKIRVGSIVTEKFVEVYNNTREGGNRSMGKEVVGGNHFLVQFEDR